VVVAARCQICCASLNLRSVEEENFFIVSLASALIFLQLCSFSEIPMYGHREDLPSIRNVNKCVISPFDSVSINNINYEILNYGGEPRKTSKIRKRDLLIEKHNHWSVYIDGG